MQGYDNKANANIKVVNNEKRSPGLGRSSGDRAIQKMATKQRTKSMKFNVQKYKEVFSQQLKGDQSSEVYTYNMAPKNRETGAHHPVSMQLQAQQKSEPLVIPKN